MAREARVVAEAVPSPITQRGNNRQDIFLLGDDRRFYIEALNAKAGDHGLTILGWCLMTNHVHLVGIPRRPDSLAKAIWQAHWRYTMRFMRRYGRSGRLWQGRFYSCPLGPTLLVGHGLPLPEDHIVHRAFQHTIELAQRLRYGPRPCGRGSIAGAIGLRWNGDRLFG